MTRERSDASALTSQEPDPAEFDPEFVIGEEDDGLSVRTGTPVSQSQGQEQDGSGNGRPLEGLDEKRAGQDRLGALKERDAVSKEEQEKTVNETKMEIKDKDAQNAKQEKADEKEELSPELKVKLRRLDKLEPKYQGMTVSRYFSLFYLTHAQSF